LDEGRASGGLAEMIAEFGVGEWSKTHTQQRNPHWCVPVEPAAVRLHLRGTRKKRKIRVTMEQACEEQKAWVMHET
jgi:hypothetical protein